MNRSLVVTKLCIVVSVLLSVRSSQSRADESRPVEVALRTSVTAPNGLLTLGDVAELSGGDSATRDRIESLDVANSPSAGDTATVSKKRVCLRLLLAGYSSMDFVVSGPDEVSVFHRGSSEESTRTTITLDEATIENSIRDALAERFHIASEDLEVHLAAPFAPIPEMAGVSSRRLRIEPYLPSALRLGRTQMRVGLFLGDEVNKTISVTSDIARYQKIARATELIMPGDSFTDRNIKTARERITSYAQYISAIDAIGRKAKRSIRAGEAVRVYDVDDRRDTSPILVKPRDRVHLIARKGCISVTLTDAEVLKPGRLGEYILVKNPRSGKQVVGRVISRSEVEVSF